MLALRKGSNSGISRCNIAVADTLTPAAWCLGPNHHHHCLQGAATEVYLATSPDTKGGEYYADCNISPSTAASHDDELGRKLWELSEKLVAEAGL